ncbi:hypothetical protein EX461_18055 [Vibrio parahaemolyticus]|nr:hypothetical protein [Vibrio parahaemolyticus]EJG0012996.1 hypothetical protein [Vibrio parahaemolyticus]EJG0782054.1 hypothetical protein [Vibrio parahaemolyticus]EJS9799265.1 hypothetical protein [Vibrio parahaemolyticus]
MSKYGLEYKSGRGKDVILDDIHPVIVVGEFSIDLVDTGGKLITETIEFPHLAGKDVQLQIEPRITYVVTLTKNFSYTWDSTSGIFTYSYSGDYDYWLTAGQIFFKLIRF